MTLLNEKPEKNAYLNDGALILYFDMAETPFISRFDLDSLAQANFEVADKKDGMYSLVLRDYTGQVQTIGQFNSKADAHNALQAILKALLSSADKDQQKKRCSLWCFVKAVLKFLIALAILLALLLGYAWLKSPALIATNIPVSSGKTAPVAAPVVSSPELPQGEAVDADQFLNQAVPAAPVSTAPSATPKE